MPLKEHQHGNQIVHPVPTRVLQRVLVSTQTFAVNRSLPPLAAASRPRAGRGFDETHHATQSRIGPFDSWPRLRGRAQSAHGVDPRARPLKAVAKGSLAYTRSLPTDGMQHQRRVAGKCGGPTKRQGYDSAQALLEPVTIFRLPDGHTAGVLWRMRRMRKTHGTTAKRTSSPDARGTGRASFGFSRGKDMVLGCGPQICKPHQNGSRGSD